MSWQWTVEEKGQLPLLGEARVGDLEFPPKAARFSNGTGQDLSKGQAEGARYKTHRAAESRWECTPLMYWTRVRRSDKYLSKSQWLNTGKVYFSGTTGLRWVGDSPWQLFSRL